MELLAPIYAVLFFFVAVLFCDRSNCLNLTNHLHTSVLNNASATALINTSVNSSLLVTELKPKRVSSTSLDFVFSLKLLILKNIETVENCDTHKVHRVLLMSGYILREASLIRNSGNNTFH